MSDTPILFTELATLAGIDITQTIQAQIDAIGTTLTLDNGKIFVGNASNVPTDISLSGGVTITNTGLATLGPNCGYATTATAAGTTVLTVTSKMLQYFTGSTTQTVTLPVTSTLALGWKILVVNNSSGVVTVNSSGANLVSVVSPGTSLSFTCILISGTDAASWDVTGSNADITSALISGFSTGAGTVAGTDTILQGFNKLAGNTQNLTVIANVLTGYSAASGVVSSADTILGALQKIDGNNAGARVANVTVTAANIAAMNGAPVTLIAAPAAGVAIVVDEITAFHDFAVAAYTNGGDVSILYGDAGAVINLFDVTLISGGADTQTVARPTIYDLDAATGTAIGFNLVDKAAVAVKITNATAAFATGDVANILKLQVRYHLTTLLT